VGRIILILTVACLLATFMIISNSSFKPATNASPTKEEVSKKAEKDRTRKPEQTSPAKTTNKGATNSSQPSSATNSKESSVGAGAMEEGEKNRDQDVAHAIVKDNYTPVYSVNSRQSSVVGLLKKGDKVATELEVLDEKGRWTIVKRGDLTRPGFVLDANLQRANTTKKTEK
jgi:hypothetical protein